MPLRTHLRFHTCGTMRKWVTTSSPLVEAKLFAGRNVPAYWSGEKDLVSYALLNNSPHEDTIGRSQKVGKEEIVGMVKALECYLQEDHAALNSEWQRRLEAVSAQITRVPGVTTRFYLPDMANHVPHMEILWDKSIAASPQEVVTTLRKGNPSIVLSAGDDSPHVSMNSFMLQPGEEKIIGDALVTVLKAHAS